MIIGKKAITMLYKQFLGSADEDGPTIHETYPAQLCQGRFLVPTDFAPRSTNIIATGGVGPCVLLLPVQHFSSLTKSLLQIEGETGKQQSILNSFKRILLGNASLLLIDHQGYVTLPEHLLAFLGNQDKAIWLRHPHAIEIRPDAAKN